MYFRIALTILVRRRARRVDRRGIDGRAPTQQQTTFDPQRVGLGQQTPCKTLLLQPMPKAQDRTVIRNQVGASVQPCTRAQRRNIVQRFFHARIGQGEPLLYEVNPQHRFCRERCPVPADR